MEELLASGTLWEGCKGSIWNYDDFETCHRQRYLEYIPLASLLAVLITYTSYCVLYYFLNGSGDAQASEADPDATVFHPKDNPDENARIVLRTRSISDRLRIAAELVLNAVQAVLVYALVTDHDVAKHYSRYAPYTPYALGSLVFYTLALSIYRFLAARSPKHLLASPFTQEAYIYTLLWVVYGVNWYSQINHSYSNNVSSKISVLLAIATANWLILFSSPVGDQAARQYTVQSHDSKMTIPSSEPTSSLLTIMSCSWCFDLVRRAQRNPLNQEDVPDLTEDDHVFNFLRRAGMLPERWSFLIRLIVTLRKQITLNLFYGLSGAVLKLTPTIFIQKILEFLEFRAVPNSVGWLYVFALGATYLLDNVVINQAFYQGRKLSLGVRSLVIGSVYRKALFQRVSQSKQSTEDGEGADDTSESTKKDEDDEDEEFDSTNTGAIINLMSVDAFKLADFSAYLHDVPAIPLQVLISIVFLYSVLGWSAFVAVGVMVAMMPVNLYFAKRLNNVQEKLMAVTDKRIEKTNELLSAIRIVKFYAWERQFTDKVLAIRDKELRLLLWRYIFWVGNGFLFFLIPVFVVISTFWCFVRYQGGTLTTSIAFTALAVFNIMRVPLNELAYIFTDLSSTIVSLRRVQTFLTSDETTKYEQLEFSADADTIGFENATFTWEADNTMSNGTRATDDSFKLRNINIKFITGDLNVIVGQTGSGKTSLLLALLGEMKKEKGHVYLPFGNRRSAEVDEDTKLANTVAYCSQEAWLVNDTIKNNILFAHKFDKKRYNEVIDACELRRDLEILEKGDQTLIGDKGIALSGGQKQRVSLARAVYSNSRHLILDDCLSAVDAHTAEALYENALNGPLTKNRTIILVSHNIALTIGKAAAVTVLSNGKVAAHGTPAEVSASGALGDDELVSRNAQSAAVSRTQSVQDLPTLAKTVIDQDQPGITTEPIPLVVEEDVEDAVQEEEARATGRISFATYARFLREFVNPRELSIALVLAVLVAVFEYLQSWWVKLWAASSESGADETIFNAMKSAVAPRLRDTTQIHSIHFTGHGTVDEDVLANLRFYSIGYVAIGVAGTLSAIIRELIVYYGGLRASRRIFKKLLMSITHAKTHFHDTTPSGRIVNRFSKDMEVIDQEITANLLWFAISLIDGLQVTMVVIYVTPVMIPLAVAMGYLFLLVGRAYLASARELKRIEAITRSPIFQQFGETLTGSVVIRAYGDTDRFLTTNWKSVDETHRPYFWLWVANRWLSFWCSMLSLMVCVLAATFIVATADTIDPGFAGISLSFSAFLGDCILWILRMYASCEVSMNSVERVTEYLDVEQEAQGIIPESRPPSNWPSKGNVVFKNLSLQYSDDLPMVIKNVSFEIPPGNKVGIVGRTGAGKSTIITAMFRMLEPAGGSIVIDDVDVSTIGLEDLRSGLAIIPQDPTLFKGSLRSNLDMFDEYTDEKIFKALAHAHLVPEGTTPESIRDQQDIPQIEGVKSENANPFFDLDRSVDEGGRNLSQGQRQLLCLARAILKEPRILLLDEATASIDYETDSLIQETIRESFKSSTIMTIAHRLRTIADYDLILVLEKGEVAQFAHPYDLLQDKEGIFYGMCQKSGEFDTLVSLAEKSKASSQS